MKKSTITPVHDPVARVRARARRLVRELRAQREAGMATAEFAVMTLVAIGIGMVLMTVINSGGLSGLLEGWISQAFTF